MKSKRTLRSIFLLIQIVLVFQFAKETPKLVMILEKKRGLSCKIFTNCSTVKALLNILKGKMVSHEYLTSLSSIRKNQEHIWRKSKLQKLKKKKSKRMKSKKLVTKSSR